MPKGKDAKVSTTVANDNYGKASERIGELWQAYKQSAHANGSEAYTYNTFRQQLEARSVRQTYQQKKDKDQSQLKQSAANVNVERHNSGNNKHNTQSTFTTTSIAKRSFKSPKMDNNSIDINMDIDGDDNLGRSTNPKMSAGRPSGVHSSPVWLSRGTGGDSQSHTFTFRKKRIFYSYGFAFKRVDIPTPGNTEYPHSGIATPLASLWVDFVPSYLSSAEFNSLIRCGNLNRR